MNNKLFFLYYEEKYFLYVMLENPYAMLEFDE
jgi:hypothetical protein